jgi:hypothetical protein
MKGRIAAWVFDNIPLPGWAQPWVFGMIIGRWPHKVKKDDNTRNTNL